MRTDDKVLIGLVLAFAAAAVGLYLLTTQDAEPEASDSFVSRTATWLNNLWNGSDSVTVKPGEEKNGHQTETEPDK